MGKSSVLTLMPHTSFLVPITLSAAVTLGKRLQTCILAIFAAQLSTAEGDRTSVQSVTPKEVPVT